MTDAKAVSSGRPQACGQFDAPWFCGLIASAENSRKQHPADSAAAGTGAGQPAVPGRPFRQPEPDAPGSTSLLEDAMRQLSGKEVREPPSPVSVVKVTPLRWQPRRRRAACAPSGSAMPAPTYVEIDGLRVLLDPVLAERVSLLPVGPRRFHPTPVALADLPTIDAVLISHDHHDLLDMVTRAAPGVARFALLRPAGHRRAPRVLGRAGGAGRATRMVAVAFARRTADRLHAHAAPLPPSTWCTTTVGNRSAGRWPEPPARRSN